VCAAPPTLLACAFVLEGLSAHTHARVLHYPTAGFAYDETLDRWRCPEGEHLWPHEFDEQRRLVRYRAEAHVCNPCPHKATCTDSDRGREIVRLDPWPHSEAGASTAASRCCWSGWRCSSWPSRGPRHHRPEEAALM
jgi:hypothetical protein